DVQERRRSRSPVERRRSRSRSRERRDDARRRDLEERNRSSREDHDRRDEKRPKKDKERELFGQCPFHFTFTYLTRALVTLTYVFSAEVLDVDSLKGADKEIAKMMGFVSFSTTKNKKVTGNTDGVVMINKPRRYRQYMNRKGGFNRPLDYVA
ncbi:unnamed protein product, partial [Anisakis simplex]|uniref:U4/U6.U5 small nuclear ribonucleoprotein 27 kDa protein n=1 Tax=Anisakis simplex TaxID=6269 RepID=A0A0M3K012_ANISI